MSSRWLTTCDRCASEIAYPVEVERDRPVSLTRCEVYERGGKLDDRTVCRIDLCLGCTHQFAAFMAGIVPLREVGGGS